MADSDQNLWRLNLFGPLLSVAPSGEEFRIKSRKAAELVAFLALRRNPMVDRDQIAEGLWSEADLVTAPRVRFAGYRSPVAGKLVILSGPSGVGKDAVLEAWQAVNPNVRRVVAATTRPPRSQEVDGIDYHFLSSDAFEAMVAAGGFLEYKKVYGNYYGTPLEGMNALVRDGRTAVLKIDVQGALTAMEKLPDALSVFILPPSIEVLEERLRGRGTDSPESVAVRLQEAQAEIALSDHYQFKLVNNEISQVVSKLEALTCQQENAK